MRGHLGSLFMLGFLGANTLGGLIPTSKRDQIDPLDRAHYGLRIRNVLDHIYDSASLEKRADGKSDYPCRPGGSPQYDEKHRLSHCIYNTPIEKYNRAIRDIHYKHKRRELDDSTAVYFYNSSSVSTPQLSERDTAKGRTYDDSNDAQWQVDIFDVDKKDEDDPSYILPPNWTRQDDAYCYHSGTWAYDVEFATILRPFCSLANVSTIYKSGFVTHATFFYADDAVDGRQGDPILHDEGSEPSKGVTIEFDAEIMGPSGWLPPPDAVLACLTATKHFIYYSCQGKNNDQRGGRVTARYTGYTAQNPALSSQDWSFELDPNDGEQGEAPSCTPGINCP
ncbi:hypothetical protein AA313_de0208809 [Arthrobotrys entomopaga]|nr:hypothetical protein AA313_de0208809 [Arthrobotrys entomopaga]